MPPGDLAYWMGKFCLRCANRMAVSIHRNPYMLWFAASKDFITKMNATILIHYVLLMKDLENFEPPSMLKRNDYMDLV